MMYSEEAFSIVSTNLSYACHKKSAAGALILGQMEEIALIMAEMTEDGEDLDQKRRVWSEAMRALGEHADRVELSARYYDALKQKKGTAEQTSAVTAIRSVSYLRNRGSDGAYDCFTKGMDDVRALYVNGNDEALEGCYDEYADACILPYSDPERGLHTGFRMMIARYGLKINGMVRVETREGNAMDYVLLRREVPIIRKEAYLAITLPVADGADLCQYLQSAKRCGLSQGCIQKLPETFANVENYDLHFYGTREAIDRYLFYLSLNSPRYELLGIYRKERETI